MWSVSIVSTLIFLILSPLSICANCPDGFRIRKDYRDMSSSEWNEFVKAVKKLQTTTGKSGLTIYEEFTKLHADYMPEAHAGANFGFWHRIYLKKYEDALREANPKFTALPYWDWSADYALPHKASIWKPEFLGGSQSDGISQAQCLTTGPLAGVQFNYPNRHCLKRGFSEITGRSTAFQTETRQIRFYSPPELTQIIRSDANFDSFHDTLQYMVHSVPHTYIGGVDGDMYFINRAPNDMVFTMHHAYIDVILNSWQVTHNTFNFNRVTPFNAWPGTKSSDGFSLDAMCIKYQVYSPFRPTPISSTSTTTTASSTATSTPAAAATTTTSSSSQAAGQHTPVIPSPAVPSPSTSQDNDNEEDDLYPDEDDDPLKLLIPIPTNTASNTAFLESTPTPSSNLSDALPLETVTAPVIGKYYNTSACPYLPPPNSFLPPPPERWSRINMYPHNKIMECFARVNKITKLVQVQAGKGVFFLPPTVKGGFNGKLITNTPLTTPNNDDSAGLPPPSVTGGDNLPRSTLLYSGAADHTNTVTLYSIVSTVLIVVVGMIVV